MPFSGGIDSLSNGTLLFSLGAAILYFIAWHQDRDWRRKLAGPAAIGLLALLGYLERGPLLLIGGLAIAAAGEAWIAHNKSGAFLFGQAGWALRYLALAAITLGLLI